MVARIKTGKSLKGAINYNEAKVKQDKASLTLASSYSKPLDDLNFYDKWMRLEKLAAMNERTKTNCLHVSLNFDPKENLGNEILQQIATTYMNKIGFGKQPFLVYEHHDAAHQHIHIVTTNIQKDGTRISMHNLGKTLSEQARKEIEIEFCLVKADEKKKGQQENLQRINIKKAMYGKMETKRAISGIVTQVISQYKFTSLPEFNAILNHYGLTAVKTYNDKGLLYSLLDDKGNKIGVPIKASSIYGKPTLKTLERLFELNKQKRFSFKQPLKDSIDSILSNQNIKTKQQFVTELSKQNIHIIFRANEQNFIYGITYVDHNNKAVFNGSDLGKEYSAAAILQRFDLKEVNTQPNVQKPEQHSNPINIKTDIPEIIMSAEENPNWLPYELKKKRKRKKNFKI